MVEPKDDDMVTFMCTFDERGPIEKTMPYKDYKALKKFSDNMKLWSVKFDKMYKEFKEELATEIGENKNRNTDENI